MRIEFLNDNGNVVKTIDSDYKTFIEFIENIHYLTELRKNIISISKELENTLWYIKFLCDDLGIDMQDIAKHKRILSMLEQRNKSNVDKNNKQNESTKFMF